MIWRIAAALAAALSIASMMALLVPPPARLSRRLMPHLAAPLGRLGRPPVAQPGARSTARRFRSALEVEQPATAARLRSSGLWPDLPPESRLDRYRTRVVARAGLLAAVAVAGGLAVRSGVGEVMVMAGIGVVAGVASARSSVDRAIARRRVLMRLELPTVCQLLALWVRTGGGVVAACSQLSERGAGEIAGEIAEALRAHRAGATAHDAFSRIAGSTPEPFAARCYRLLAGAERRGTDIAGALLGLAGELRTEHRETVRREATRRRAAMLLPIIGILAPTLVLFVAAPLPWIVLRAL